MALPFAGFLSNGVRGIIKVSASKCRLWRNPTKLLNQSKTLSLLTQPVYFNDAGKITDMGYLREEVRLATEIGLKLTKLL